MGRASGRARPSASSAARASPPGRDEFHKNGRAVDPYEQQLPPADPRALEYRAAFDDVVETYRPLLQARAPDDMLAVNR